MKRMSITDGTEFLCPFCGKECVASLQNYAVIHRLPTCTRFDQLRPDQFLAEVNDALKKKSN